MEYGLIGERLGHSYSREIHRKIGDYDYELLELRPDELGGFLERREFKAINVTIPYKEKVMPYLYDISESAEKIGAVNTIVNRDGRLYGYNTDFAGICSTLEHRGISLAGKKVLILGTGGTSKTATAAAVSLGAASVTCVSRTAKDGAITYEEAFEKCRDTEILINATPVGMYPKIDGKPVEIERFPSLEGIMDVIYNPLRTNLVLDGEERGIPSVGGLFMLAAQAVHASALLFGSDSADVGTIAPVFKKVLDEKQNIVLIGMPGSGKSTVGKLIAERTGKEFIDTDLEIIKKTGMQIPEIFASSGEAGFRQIEREVISSLAAKSGCVVSTGGGAVLDPANMRAMRHNGRICFIDRDPEALAYSSDRPLASSREKIFELYKVRYDKYKAAAELTVTNDDTPEALADKIISA